MAEIVAEGTVLVVFIRGLQAVRGSHHLIGEDPAHILLFNQPVQVFGV